MKLFSTSSCVFLLPSKGSSDLYTWSRLPPTKDVLTGEIEAQRESPFSNRQVWNFHLQGVPAVIDDCVPDPTGDGIFLLLQTNGTQNPDRAWVGVTRVSFAQDRLSVRKLGVWKVPPHEFCREFGTLLLLRSNETQENFLAAALPNSFQLAPVSSGVGDSFKWTPMIRNPKIRLRSLDKMHRISFVEQPRPSFLSWLCNFSPTPEEKEIKLRPIFSSDVPSLEFDSVSLESKLATVCTWKSRLGVFYGRPRRFVPLPTARKATVSPDARSVVVWEAWNPEDKLFVQPAQVCTDTLKTATLRRLKRLGFQSVSELKNVLPPELYSELLLVDPF